MLQRCASRFEFPFDEHQWLCTFMSTLHHAQPLSLCAANGQMQGQHPKGEHVEGMNLKSQCLGPKGLSKNYLHYVVQNDPNIHDFTFCASRENPQRNPRTNGWMETATFIASLSRTENQTGFSKFKGGPIPAAAEKLARFGNAKLFQIAICCRFHKLILENA